MAAERMDDDRDRYGSVNTHSGIPPAKKIEALRLIKEGKELDHENATDSDIDFSERVFKVGEFVDCQDSVNKWLVGQVVKIDANRIEVNFVGWPSKWNEHLDVSDPRMRPLGTRCPREVVEATLKPLQLATAATAASAAGAAAAAGGATAAAGAAAAAGGAAAAPAAVAAAAPAGGAVQNVPPPAAATQNAAAPRS